MRALHDVVFGKPYVGFSLLTAEFRVKHASLCNALLNKKNKPLSIKDEGLIERYSYRSKKANYAFVTRPCLMQAAHTLMWHFLPSTIA